MTRVILAAYQPSGGDEMGRLATKVAVSIPGPLFLAVERVRKASGKSRSAVIQDALRHWLDSQAQAALVREYEAGYRRKPEGRREIKAAEAAAVPLLATEAW
jgi:Arc/MetJ-type ribon-helix-helix transcriptional regulator